MSCRRRFPVEKTPVNKKLQQFILFRKRAKTLYTLFKYLFLQSNINMAPPNAVGSFAVLIGTLAVLFNFSLHKIDEGYVGVYYRVGSHLIDYNNICLNLCLF